MQFTEIDFSTWPRRETFVYFSKMAPTGYSLTVDVDVTELTAVLKTGGRKFFPTYLWLVTKCLNRQQEFRIALADGKLGYYDSLTPLYAHFHDDDHTFSLMWTEYQEDYEAFCRQYLINQQTYGCVHGVLAQKETLPPPNAYTVSAIPWVRFSHFAVHSYENKPYYFPSVEAGKIQEDRTGRKILPLSLTCHHAVTDGYHVSRFLDDLTAEMASFCADPPLIAAEGTPFGGDSE